MGDWTDLVFRAVIQGALSLFLSTGAGADNTVTPESIKIRPGDLERPIIVANSVNWGTPNVLFMKLKPTLEVGTLELSHFYWDGTLNRATQGAVGRFFGQVRLHGEQRIYVNRVTGYVYLGNQIVGGIYRLANLDIIAVFFVAPINVDLTTDTVKIGPK